MENTRQKKFARVIQRELSELLRLHYEPKFACLLTVSYVTATPDLQTTRVYLTCFPDDKTAFIVKNLNEEQKNIRYLLAGKIGRITRVMPTIVFYEDDLLKEAAKIDKILSEVMPFVDTEREEGVNLSDKGEEV